MFVERRRRRRREEKHRKRKDATAEAVNPGHRWGRGTPDKRYTKYLYQYNALAKKNVMRKKSKRINTYIFLPFLPHN